MEINEEKRQKFMEYAGKRVNNVLHDMQILEPMARSSVYDFTKQDIEEMFDAMQETLNNVKAEFEKKFEEKARAEKKVFSFGQSAATVVATPTASVVAPVAVETVAEAIATAEVAEPAIVADAEETF